MHEKYKTEFLAVSLSLKRQIEQLRGVSIDQHSVNLLLTKRAEIIRELLQGAWNVLPNLAEAIIDCRIGKLLTIEISNNILHRVD